MQLTPGGSQRPASLLHSFHAAASAGTGMPPVKAASCTRSVSTSSVWAMRSWQGTPCPAAHCPLQQHITALGVCRVISYATVEADERANVEPTASLVSAGAIAPQQDLSTDANACSYGETYRLAVRGGAYIATPADYPQPSLYVSSITCTLLMPEAASSCGRLQALACIVHAGRYAR